VPVDPIKLKLKRPGTKRLKLKCDILLSTFAFKINLRRYNLGSVSTAFSDVVIDSIVVQRARGESQALSGSLQSLCWGSVAGGLHALEGGQLAVTGESRAHFIYDGQVLIIGGSVACHRVVRCQ